jgi:hypothetical protein
VGIFLCLSRITELEEVGVVNVLRFECNARIANDSRL